MSADYQGFYVKHILQKISATFRPSNLQKIRPRIFPAAEILFGPLLWFAAELSASW
jgi:hypothetical protein